MFARVGRAALRKTTIVVAVAALFAVGTVGASAESRGSLAGGTFRVGWEGSFSFTDGFDPTGEYYYAAFGIYSNLLLRTLVGYDHLAGPAGNRVVPDLATAVPTPTDGGKTYTFHLKPGVKFGPPVDRAITSKDVLFAMERLADPKNGAQYGFYYPIIQGWDAYSAGQAKTISGIRTPNDSTIVFHLTRPAGDFLFRMAMPATAPMPHEVAGCFSGGDASRYGRDVVSSGPYMIAGMDKIDDSSCAKVKPASGFDGQTTMDLVRNPDYDPKTDSTKAREALPDEFLFTVDGNATDIVDRIGAGDLDDILIPSLPAQTVEHYSSDPKLRPLLHLYPNDLTNYITMNLTQPPFDDVHVRRALNWIMDKGALQQAWGGPLTGRIAHHIAPDTMFDDQLADYDPYATPGSDGSLAKAKAAMRGSKYDTAHDGTCGASQCKHVLMLADAHQVDTKMVPVIEASAAKIGITFKVRVVNGAFPTLQTPKNNVPIGEFPGWAKDFADPITFFGPLFDGRGIIPTGNTNYALVGITPAIAKKVGATGTVTGVPSVNAWLDRCAPLAGQARLSCYESLDRYLTTTIVAWVPYRWSYNQDITSANVTKWGFDQFSGATAWAHVAVKR
jgi:peptide/nickel transport system substrate-binding protein